MADLGAGVGQKLWRVQGTEWLFETREFEDCAADWVVEGTEWYFVVG